MGVLPWSIGVGITVWEASLMKRWGRKKRRMGEAEPAGESPLPQLPGIALVRVHGAR